MTFAAVAALAAMGAFHGLNPGMGWLFAVAVGVQERSRAAMLRALAPIAAGHALSILVVAGLIAALQSVLATRAVAIGGGVLLVAVGLWRALARRHPAAPGLRLTALPLAGWSFLMSSIHGAGLMLVPILVAGTAAGGHRHGTDAGPLPWWAGLLATAVHTVAMVVVAGAIALVVDQAVGPRLLRSPRLSLDRVWAVVLIGAGLATLAAAV
jgi:threonine/homoserine/homoserine lactone efflux protein